MTRTFDEQVAALEKDWAENPRWKGVTRDYTAADVVRLRGSVTPEYTMARNGAVVSARPARSPSPANRGSAGSGRTTSSARASGGSTGLSSIAISPSATCIWASSAERSNSCWAVIWMT